ncbi:MAG: hypothetical protein OXS47_08420 [Chloroflexota bacterium]|nr:hypothetical protein [Chloroflexota bacterium]
MKEHHRLSDEQEQQRLAGLRILARIIARHYLAHPDLYPGASVEDQETPSRTYERDVSGDGLQEDDAA